MNITSFLSAILYMTPFVKYNIIRDEKMSEKGKGVLAYIFTWIGGLIVLYGMKDNERNTKIHAAQAIVIGIGYMVIYMIYRFIPVYIPFFSTIVYGLYIALVIIGIVKVNKGEDPELPVVGKIAMSLFDKKINEWYYIKEEN